MEGATAPPRSALDRERKAARVRARDSIRAEAQQQLDGIAFEVAAVLFPHLAESVRIGAMVKAST